MQPVRQRHYLPEFLGAMGAVCVLFFVPSVHAQSISAEPTVNRLPSEFNAYLAEGYRQMALVAARAALGDRIVYYFRQRDALAAEGETIGNGPRRLWSTGLSAACSQPSPSSNDPRRRVARTTASQANTTKGMRRGP